MIWFWLGAILLFAVAEAVTTALVSVWFIVGAAAGLVGAGFQMSVLMQAVLFVLVSVVSLAATRPLVRRFSNRKTVPTNADRVIGRVTRVTEPIDNEAGTGAVHVDGKTWTARSQNGSPIPAGEPVTIAEIRGVTLYVTAIPGEQSGIRPKLDKNHEEVEETCP